MNTGYIYGTAPANLGWTGALSLNNNNNDEDEVKPTEVDLDRNPLELGYVLGKVTTDGSRDYTHVSDVYNNRNLCLPLLWYSTGLSVSPYTTLADFAIKSGNIFETNGSYLKVISKGFGVFTAIVRVTNKEFPVEVSVTSIDPHLELLASYLRITPPGDKAIGPGASVPITVATINARITGLSGATLFPDVRVVSGNSVSARGNSVRYNRYGKSVMKLIYRKPGFTDTTVYLNIYIDKNYY